MNKLVIKRSDAIGNLVERRAGNIWEKDNKDMADLIRGGMRGLDDMTNDELSTEYRDEFEDSLSEDIRYDEIRVVDDYDSDYEVWIDKGGKPHKCCTLTCKNKDRAMELACKTVGRGMNPDEYSSMRIVEMK